MIMRGWVTTWLLALVVRAGRVMNVVCGDRVQGFAPWSLVRAPAAGAIV